MLTLDAVTIAPCEIRVESCAPWPHGLGISLADSSDLFEVHVAQLLMRRGYGPEEILCIHLDGVELPRASIGELASLAPAPISCAPTTH